ncbi:GTP cyclohydrolase II RibA [Burkholderia ambifaria]|jgi:GTP cyclohydrolase II|uniref:GTP cyclohydrolase II n=1 Tax=Burkholderia ambifaria (strain ATCC BAA-244 / DSM 16087 / CCUG 44356 / LMG 19182 / AMMD) TaxID=339670 RepID=Q0BF86_BURCM|nr:GTP cyclohydrolase II [Burkholderia ambifaria]ABI87187.1 GTP cyclohydrolase II [Burkholderia ambifaria AMMD]MBR7928676.1 GTP cyclohydrolase II [Burkholderia ambifaria]PEH65591.1 GTP cyclohydrolase II RibA [Burkholderia ambifaria]QQC05594.1 GTP cyclohydrolase II [Burkholderia ambifaria]UZU03623.1 GTP cyclohydrolase II [Burkholderia ambifaria]
MNDGRISPVLSASVRTRVSVPIRPRTAQQRFDTEMVTFYGLCDSGEHLALVFEPLVDAPLVRMHSECLTGDVFGSSRCDCGEQLDESIATFGRKGGILLYLRQEGRGIGLYNKLDAYRLQILQGLDTFAANRALNFPEDMRDYRVAAQMLRVLGVTEISLVTNNPDKSSQLEKHGIRIRRVLQTGVFANGTNHDYLRAKIDQHRHTINLGQELQ